MRPLFQILAFATLGVASLFTTAHADPLDPATVPGDSKWVIHIDMDAVRKSASWKDIYDRLQKAPDFVPKVTELENIFNARFPDDLHGVTLFGAGFADHTGVVMINANVDRKQVEGLLAQGAKNTSTPRGDHSLLSWDDKGEKRFGSFFSDSKFLISSDKDSVGFALDVLDGKADGLKPDDVLAAGLKPDADKKPGILIYIAGDGLARLRAQAARSPLLAQMKSAYILLAEDRDDLVLKLNITAGNAQAATKMQQSAEGIRAMLGMKAAEDGAPANLVKLNDIVQKATLAANGNNASLELRVAQKELPAMLDEAIKNRKN